MSTTLTAPAAKLPSPRMSRRERRDIRSVRPFLQRTFIHWFHRRRHAFALPIRLGKRDARHLHLVVSGAPPEMDFVLCPDGPQVFVYVNGECWDWIYWGEIYPRRVAHGYVCKLCCDPPSPVYETRAAIWEEHCFEQFLAWFNEKYGQARWLYCCGSADGGATWANLRKEAPDDPDENPDSKYTRVVIPLHTGRKPI